MADTAGSILKRRHPEDEEDDSSTKKRARSINGSPRPTTPRASAPGPDAKPDTSEDRMAQLRARVAAATSRSASLAQQKKAPTSPAMPQFADMPRSRGGLDIGLHPALLADVQRIQEATKDRTTGRFGRRGDSPAAKKEQLDLSGPSIEEIKANPYFDPNIGRGAVGKVRHSRQLIFNQQGKYIQQAANLRRLAQLEEMKRKIAEHTRAAGMDEELDLERAFLVPQPPAIEWWDEGLVNGDSYDALSDPGSWKIETPDSVITVYIQHPVLIEPPQEKMVPAAKPMYLTKDEQAKLRRQRRMADLKEQQAKIRLGLEPAPPPKVKKSNLMRVLGEEAVKDPTAVEARVNREISERKQNHEHMNQERKLSKEQRAEKLERQQADDEAKGIHIRVYKIGSLANGKHRYQIEINAQQMKLTGVCILHPRMNLVIVEGGEHSIHFYDKLMLNRIKWQEMEAPRSVQEGNRTALAKWLEAEDENGQLRDLSLNKCELIFKGEERQRAFKRWYGGKPCESDSQAKDVLSRAKMESFWNLAKSSREPDY
ncbi:hypothetical protein DV737_g4793, partial [Chaetothyriales sp. CBS 132003]